MSDAQPAADVEEDVAAPVSTAEAQTVSTESEGEISLDSDEIISLDGEPEAAATEGQEQREDEVDSVEDDSDDTAEDGGDEDAEDDGEEAAPEMRTFDFGGNKLEFPVEAVPPELATKIDEFSKGVWGSATKSLQQTAERSKSLDAQEATVAKIADLNGAALETYTRGLQLRSEIEQLSSLDLRSEWQSNPDRARQVSDALVDKQKQFQQTLALVQQQESEAEAAKGERLRAIAIEGGAMLDKKFKDFSTTKAPQLIEHIRQQHPNISQRELDTWALNPVITEYAYKAMLYDKQSEAKVRPNKQPAQAKPVTALRSAGKATAPRAPDKMGMGQLRKHLGLRG